MAGATKTITITLSGKWPKWLPIYFAWLRFKARLGFTIDGEAVAKFIVRHSRVGVRP